MRRLYCALKFTGDRAAFRAKANRPARKRAASGKIQIPQSVFRLRKSAQHIAVQVFYMPKILDIFCILKILHCIKDFAVEGVWANKPYFNSDAIW